MKGVMKGRPRVNVEPCKFCNKEFKRQEHLDRHLRTHTQEKPFACECGRLFSRKDLLHRHHRLSQCPGAPQIPTAQCPASSSCTTDGISSLQSHSNDRETPQYAAAVRPAGGARVASVARLTEASNYSHHQQLLGRFSVNGLPTVINWQDSRVIDHRSGMDVSMDVSIGAPIELPMESTMETPDFSGQSTNEFDLDFLSNETDMLSNYLIGMFPTINEPHQITGMTPGYMSSPGRQIGHGVDTEIAVPESPTVAQPLRLPTIEQVLRQTPVGSSTAALPALVTNENKDRNREVEADAQNSQDIPNTENTDETADNTTMSNVDTENSDPLDSSLDALDGMVDDTMSSNPWAISSEAYERLASLVQKHEKLIGAEASPDADVDGRVAPFRLPSRHVLSRYVANFVRSFHPHLPFMHLGTMRLDKMDPMLLLTLAATGSFYGFEHTDGYAMYAVAKSVIIQALERRRRARTAHLLRSFPRYAEMPMPATTAADTVVSVETTATAASSQCQHEPVDMSLLQSLLTLLQTLAWMDRPLMEDALAMSSQLTELLRDCLTVDGKEEEYADNIAGNEWRAQGEAAMEDDEEGENNERRVGADNEWDVGDEDDWQRWGRYEERLRTLYSAYFVMNVLAICYDVPHPLSSAAVDLVLPSSEAEFAAPTRADWLRLMRRRRQRPSQSIPRGEGRVTTRPRFLASLHQLLAGQRLAKEVASREYGNYLLVQTLVIHIKREWQALLERPSSFLPSSSSGSGMSSAPRALPPDIVSMYANALKAWQAGWDSAIDTSPLDPNAVHGPVAFNGTTMLRLAHAQLVLCSSAAGGFTMERPGGLGNLSTPSGNLRCRNPRELALGWPGQQPLAPLKLSLRSPHVSQAVLHAIFALRIPVRVGIPFVARGRAGNWSVQHALSTFMCAQLLAHWLEAVHDIVRVTVRSSAAGADSCLAGLRQDEKRLLSMVEQLIEETHLAESLGPRGSYPGRIRRLGVAALKLWADTCKGIQVFEIVHVVGATLSIVAEGMERNEAIERGQYSERE